MTIKGIYYSIRSIYLVCWIWNFFSKKLYFPWRTINKGMKKLVTDINEASFNPDVVIAIGRGGAICGGILLSNIDIARRIEFIAIDYHRYKTQDGIPTITMNGIIQSDIIKQMVANKKVLIITGEVHSGSSLREFKSVLTTYSPKDMRIMSFFVDKKSPIKQIINFYFQITDKDFISPWLLLHEEKQH